mgnify:CR=1 FL=1|tara:strand:+ start:625 stop:1116 length:492 start_codon:yes stop_codon:yes gene_type:complete
MTASKVDFQESSTDTISRQLAKTCNVIVSSGIGIRGGQITFGGNNVLAQKAAMSIQEKALDRVNDNHGEQTRAMADVVRAAQSMYMMSTTEQKSALTALAGKIVGLKKSGWQSDAKPVNFDVNAAGAPTNTYAKPVELAKDLVETFGIGINSKDYSPHNNGLR